MKIWKLVSGILSIVLVLFVLFQSCAAGLGNALEANGEVGGSAGVLLAIFHPFRELLKLNAAAWFMRSA